MYNFDDINAILAEMRDEGMVEPIDDPNIQTHFEDWAEILGIHDQVEYA
jgi:hypothetical protein